MAVELSGIQQAGAPQPASYVESRSSVSGFDDAFSKKPGDWAFNAFFLSSINPSQDIAGHRAVRPLDSEVIDFVNLSVPPANRLPTGHLYTAALAGALESLEAEVGTGRARDASTTVLDAISVLESDASLRDYLLTRQLEYYYG